MIAIVASYVGGAAFTFGLLLRLRTDPALNLIGVVFWPVSLTVLCGWWVGGVTRDR